jgi:iron complex transport system substrate-binding protein
VIARRCAWLVPLLLLTAWPAAAVDRVVSLNLCTDQMLVLLAPGKIAALSILAQDPALSFVSGQARAYPIVRPSAEAVLRLQPELVLAGHYGAQTVLAVLEGQGIPVLRLDLPQDFAGIRVFTRRLAAVLDAPDRAEKLIAAMDAMLARRPSDHPLSAVSWQPRGYTAKPDSLMGAVIRAAGLANASDGRRIGLEEMLRHPPDLLVVPGASAFPSLATELLLHPALAHIPRREVPPSLTICPGPFSAQAVALLAR